MVARQIAISLSIGLLLLSGCSDSDPTEAESLDNQIDESWMEDRKLVDAVSFFEGGGIYESTPQYSDIDEHSVLPLIRRMKNEFGLNVQAMLDHDDPEIAFAIVADISQCDDRAPLAWAIEEADQAFAGMILDNWGNKWLSIDVLDEGETSELEEAGDLELLKRHIAARRAEYGVNVEPVE